FFFLFFIFFGFCSKRLAWLFSPNKPPAAAAGPALDNKPANPAPTPAKAPPAPAKEPAPAPKPATAPAPKTEQPKASPPKQEEAPAAAPAPPKPAPVVAPPKPTPPAKPASPPKSVDTAKMPIPLPKSLTEANTNGQNGSAGNADGGATADERLLAGLQHKEIKEPVQPKDATQDFIKGETNAFIQSIKDAHLLGELKQDTMVDAAVLAKLEEGYAKLAASDSKSLLKKYLTKEVFDNLKNKVTPTFKSTLLDVIQSGLENHDSGVGIYAPDAEAYTVFADLFDPIIEDYHGGFKKTDKHPASNFGDVATFGNVDPTNEYVISTRVRCGRSMQGYPFNPCLTEAQYKEMEGKVSSTLSGLEGELKGKFYPLTGMEKAVQQQLIDDHFLFKEGDRFLQTANACRYWPSGRGIYHNDAKTFLVWCNEEDHLRIISMQQGGDLGQIYKRLVTAVNEIEKRVPFSHDDRLGFLTFCPTNLGTTIRASVHIKVPKLASNKAKLEEVAAKYNLQVRGTRGEHTEAEGGVYDISNKRRMGLTEFDAVKEMYDGITELIKLEKSL
ncbi:hypothetical protein KR018_008155, partial [Drosophila ironensis]